MKKTLQNIVLLGALYGGSLHASFEFRSPLSFEVDARGYQHWLLAPVDQAWWYGEMPSQKKNTDWNIHMWGMAYSRSANKAFFDKCDECNNGKVTRHTGSLAQLFFGQATFLGENAFANGTFAGNQTNAQVAAGQVLVNAVNPYLAFARIAPVIEYQENGANMGFDAAKYLGANDRYHVGVRAYMPFRVIEVEPDNDASFEETLDNVYVTRIIDTNDIENLQTEYAMRFDFLSTLVFNQTAMPSGVALARPVVVYTGTGANAGITLAGQALTGNSPDQADDIPAAYATKSCDGTVPAIPFRHNPSQVAGALGADGQGTSGNTLFFETGVDYAGNLQNDRAAQSTIFITPRSISNPGGADDGTITDASRAILNFVQTLVETDLVVSEPASTFFANNGIDLGYQRIVGIGDLEAEVYGGICQYNDWFADGILGFLFPTGKRQESSNKVLYKPTGNNGHFVIKLGLDGGWQPREWFAFEIRPFFFHAFKRTEHRAAPFAGATIVNLGPEIDAKVSWSYFTLQTDFNFFHPHNPDLGFVLGYELFAKSKDHVSLDCECGTTATDLLGRPNQPLDAHNYERNTNSLTNKLRGEIFYRCNYFEIFGGGSQIVSGRHAMKESEAHLGLTIYF